ncbi:hypothetical protein FVA74_12100 [Salinibacterium sp. dk2585]|uniref:hypothetical protein n=1 Tax=unclassified Salinibacterium TaxID=2632331 RepID=UPI0011C24E94|nr:MULTISPECIES: hypothetical protein [unclassified Salinibacterium]QEE62234.1 hypothetical protein FVA74_12100 [Salinibacterium sp. dk2585]TXK53586.1 hypothetical protein FVP63_10370 [Salinibacterium sp. dk5596]
MALRHSVQDGVDASARAQRSYRPHWHPILSAVEQRPGEWWMLDQYERRYAIVRMLEVNGERGYRAVTGEPEGRQLIGYYRTLRGACYAAHLHFVRAHGQPGSVNGVGASSRGGRRA